MIELEKHLYETFCRSCGQGGRENFEIQEGEMPGVWPVVCKRCDRMFVIRCIETIMDHCVGCKRRWSTVPRAVVGLPAYTVVIKHKIRRCCNECFHSKPELQQHWMG